MTKLHRTWDRWTKSLAAQVTTTRQVRTVLPLAVIGRWAPRALPTANGIDVDNQLQLSVLRK